MSSIVVAGDTSGSITLQAPAVAGSRVLTLPTATGTLVDTTTISASTGSTLVGTTNGGTGAVTRTVASKLNDTVSVKDFGAVGDGVTDDTVAIQAAITASSGKILTFPKGTYKVSTLTVISGTFLKGEGIGQSIISSTGSNVPTFIAGGSVNNILIDGVTFDFGDIASVAATSCLGFFNCNYIKITNCEIIKFNKVGIGLNSCRYFWIEDNVITRTTSDTQGVNECILTTEAVSLGYQTTQNGWIKNNIITNSGLLIQGSYIYITENKITAWQYGAGIGIASTATTQYNVIANNTIYQGFATLDSDGLSNKGIECWGYQTTITANNISNCSGPGIFIGGQNSLISNNTIWNNGKYTAEVSGGITLPYSDATYNGNGCAIIGNNIFDTLGVSATQDYGIVLNTNTLLSDFNILANKIRGNLTGTISASAVQLALINSVNTQAIIFPSTQVPSANAYTLDDYREGTWVPTLTGFTVVGTDTSTFQYTKIGRLVTCNILLGASTSYTAASNATITLPFTPVAGEATAYASSKNTGFSAPIAVYSTFAVFKAPLGASATITMSFSYTV